MTDQDCARCERPTPDGYACTTCGITRPAGQLAEIAELASVARDIAQGQTSRSSNGGGGKPGSSIPFDLGATARLDAVHNEITTWLRHVAEERGSQSVSAALDARTHPDPLGRACLALSAQLEWMRHRPEINDLLTGIEACVRVMHGLAGGKVRRVLVGLCDCSKVLYARERQGEIECTECGATWDVDSSRETLRQALDEQLVTAAEAARLGAYLDSDRTQVQIRKLVNQWSRRGELSIDDTGPEVRHWFGNVAWRLSQAPRRAAEAAEEWQSAPAA